MELVALCIAGIVLGAGIAHLKHKLFGINLDVTPRIRSYSPEPDWSVCDDFGGAIESDAAFGGGVNPCTGLPLIDDSLVDVGGNVYGTCDEINSSALTETSCDWE